MALSQGFEEQRGVMLANKGMGECGEGHFRQEGSASTEICRDKISSAQLSLEDSLPRCSAWSWGPVYIKI